MSSLRTSGATALVAVLATGCTPVPPPLERTESVSEAEWWGALTGSPCAREVRATLAGWGASAEAMRSPPLPGNNHRFRIPTGRIGRWILLEIPSQGPAMSTKVTASGGEQVSYDSTCVATVSTLPPPDRTVGGGNEPARGRYTDRDLEAQTAGTGATVVYSWSPHMPLSVDGHREIAAACAALGIVLVPVLFPGGDAGFAASEARRGGIPPGGLREMASVELTQRNMHLHAPSVLVFSEGRISWALPGYRNEEGYRRFLERFLDASRVGDER